MKQNVISTQMFKTLMQRHQTDLHQKKPPQTWVLFVLSIILLFVEHLVFIADYAVMSKNTMADIIEETHNF